jgi:serine/threonine protein kinase
VVAEGDIIDGKYLVVRVIGEGGMGAVYEGYNKRLDKRVAIKVMHASLAKDRDLVARFEREAQAAARIASANIVAVLDLGDLPNGDRYMIMEYLEGENLMDRLKRRGPLPPAEVAVIGMQLTDGLERVHAAGIIHRDLKPANVFLARGEDGSEQVKILDFGVCKVRGAKAGEARTAVGDLLGTLPYMAPEHIEQGASSLDERADIYSVGVLLYRCVTGRLPYIATNLFDLVKQLREGRAPPVREIAPDVDSGFATIVDRAIQWDPKARYKDAHELRAALAAWCQDASRIQRLLADFLAPGEAPVEAAAAQVRRKTLQHGAVAPASDPRAEAPPSVSLPKPPPSVKATLQGMAPPEIKPPPQPRAPVPTLNAEAEVAQLARNVAMADEMTTRRYTAKNDAALLDFLGGQGREKDDVTQPKDASTEAVTRKRKRGKSLPPLEAVELRPPEDAEDPDSMQTGRTTLDPTKPRKKKR